MSPAPDTKRVSPLLEHEGKSTTLRFAPAPWVLRQCDETDFVFLENPPGYEAFKEDYAWERTWVEEALRRQTAEPTFYRISRGVKQFRSRVMKRNKVGTLADKFLRKIISPEIRVLDMGCGSGGLLAGLFSSLAPSLAQRCRPHGIELSTGLARQAEASMSLLGGHCIHDNALDGLRQFPEKHFDMIIMSSFLEHEINPLPLLRRCHERVRDGGFVIIKVPNFDCLNRHLRAERWCGFRWPDHVNYFTPSTLKVMIERAGLRVAQMNFLDRHPLSDNMYAVVHKAV